MLPIPVTIALLGAAVALAIAGAPLAVVAVLVGIALIIEAFLFIGDALWG